jgi:4-hydroxy-tetrahydrodipicolinate reductase
LFVTSAPTTKTRNPIQAAVFHFTEVMKVTMLSEVKRLKIKIAQFGLGPIGLETLRLAATRPWAQIVGAVDSDPSKAGRDLGELTGLRALKGRRVHASFEDLADDHLPDLVFHTAVSRFADAFEQLLPMVKRGVSVVSSCEELVYPQLQEPRLAAKLDRICRRSGARVVGTGVNPGFVMDVLPVCMTAVCGQVEGICIQRVVNASTRRAPLQRKIGSGLAPAEFQRRFRRGLAGHAGLKQSLALIAHCLDWRIGKIKETGRPIVASRRIRTAHLEVSAGQTCGLHQRAHATSKSGKVLELDLKMFLDAPNPHDAIQILGHPSLDILIRGGVAGDQATVAALVNTAPRLLAAPAGLRLASELILPAIS